MKHLQEALAVRRAVLGDDYVDRALADDSAGAADFQEFTTSAAWSLWTRPGLGRRDRSLLTLAVTAAMGRMDEFELHLGGARRNGVTDSEIDEIVMHIGGYAGVPAAVAARRVVRAERGRVSEG